LEKGQEQAVSEILESLEDIFSSFINLKNRNPLKFSAFLADKDRLPQISKINIDDEESIKNFFSDIKSPTEESKPDPTSVPFYLEQIYLSYTGIQVFTSVLFQIWKKSNALAVQDISQNVIQRTNNILSILCQEYSNINRNVLGYFLDLQIKITSNGLFAFDERYVYLVHSYYRWYLDQVFQKQFRLEYLTDYNKKLFIINQIIIEKNVSILFKAFVSSVIDRNLPIIYGFDNTSIIDSMDLKLDDKLSYITFDSEIKFKSTHCFSDEEFTELINKINDFEELKKGYIQNNLGQFIQYKNNIIEHIRNYFKYNNLRKVFLWIGSFCIFQKRYELLEYLLFYNQPKDSAATWVNKDINPTRIDEILTLLMNKYKIERDVLFGWGGHSDFMGYYNQYLLVLLTKIIFQSNRFGKDLSSEDYKGLIENKTKDEINQIKNELELQKSITENAFKKEKNFLTELNITNAQVNSQLIKLIDKLILNCNDKFESLEKYSNLNKEKVLDFKKAVVELFHKKSINRNIIVHFNNKKPELSPWDNKTEAYGINEISPKNYFAEGDSGMYVDWPGSYAAKMAFQDNVFINRLWSKKAKFHLKIIENQVLDKINEHLAHDTSKDSILIGTNMRFPFEVFGNEKEFIPAWQQEKKEEWWDITGFAGYYKGHEVFNNYDRTGWKSFRILNKNSLGNILQYFPIKDAKKEEIIDIFYFTIEAYSENDEILKAILDKEPDWLKQYGDKEGQKGFLLKQVRIMIFESFDIEFDEKFEGYSYYL